MNAIYNIENRGNYLHIWLDYHSLVPNNNGWVNLKIYKKNIKKKVPNWIVDEFEDLIEIESLINNK